MTSPAAFAAAGIAAAAASASALLAAAREAVSLRTFSKDVACCRQLCAMKTSVITP